MLRGEESRALMIFPAKDDPLFVKEGKKKRKRKKKIYADESS